MYEGNNPTALQSQKWITQALLEMMREKPYASISVRDICQRADLSRQTFYNLYESKEDVLHAFLRAEVAKVYSALFAESDGFQGTQPADMVGAFTQVLTANRENLRLMIDQGLRAVIADEIANAVVLFADSFVDPEDRNEEEMTYAVAFLAGGLAHILLQWVREDSPPDKERLGNIIEKIMKGKMYAL